MKAILVVALLAFSVVLVGCPKEKRALDAARKSVEVVAQTVALIDSESATLYAGAAGQALAGCESRACYESAMVRWDKTVLAVKSMKLSLLLVENSLDAWEAGSPNGLNSLFGAAACFTDSLVNLQGLLRGVGASTPVLDQGLRHVKNLFGSSGIACPLGA